MSLMKKLHDRHQQRRSKDLDSIQSNHRRKTYSPLLRSMASESVRSSVDVDHPFHESGILLKQYIGDNAAHKHYAIFGFKILYILFIIIDIFSFGFSLSLSLFLFLFLCLCLCLSLSYLSLSLSLFVLDLTLGRKRVEEKLDDGFGF